MLCLCDVAGLQALCRDARCVPAGGASELEMARQVCCAVLCSAVLCAAVCAKHKRVMTFRD